MNNHKQTFEREKEFVQKELAKLIKVARTQLASGKKPKKYFGKLDIVESLEKLKTYRWNEDEPMLGIKKASVGFVLKNPKLTDFPIKPWRQYFRFASKIDSRILILGGGDASKEVGLLQAFAASHNIPLSTKILVTDAVDPVKKLPKNKYGFQNLSTAILDLNNQEDLKSTIQSFKATIITLLSIMTVFPLQTQWQILDTIAQSAEAGSHILYGNSLPAKSLNLHGKPLSFKAAMTVKAAQDFVAATILSPSEQKQFPHLELSEDLINSSLAKSFYGHKLSHNHEWTGWLTNQINFQTSTGFQIKSVSLSGVPGKVDSDRPPSFAPYYTAFLKISKHL